MKKICIYNEKPQEAIRIRINVFVEEQGFYDEFDDIDNIAKHIVIYDDKPIGTCRVFTYDGKIYFLGRLAVIKEYRNRGIGTELIKAVENYVRQENGKMLKLHAQCRVKSFYEKMGYTEHGDVEDEEGVPHVWMYKDIV